MCCSAGKRRPTCSCTTATSPSEGVEFRQETVTAIDPLKRRVITDEGSYDADFLAVALGAEYDLAATPGFQQGGFEYYSLAGAERLRDALADFTRGRVLISVLGHPFKCPPAPFEGAFLLHDLLVKRGVRDAVDIRMTFPMAAPVPVTKEVSQLFLRALDERGIQYAPKELVVGLDPRARTARLASGGSCAVRPVYRDPRPPRTRRGQALRACARRLGARRPDEPRDSVSWRVRAGRRCHAGTAPSPRPGYSPRPPRASSRKTSQHACATASLRRPTRATALATSSSAAAWSERSRSTSWADQLQPPASFHRPASSPPRSRRSPRPGGKAGSVLTRTRFPQR